MPALHVLAKLSLVLSFCFFGALPVVAEDDKAVLQAATLHYPPYEYEINARPAGLAIDILQEAVKRTGKDGVNIEFYPWKRAVSKVQHGFKNVLFNAGKNEQRQVWGYYSNHVLVLQKYYLFTRKGKGLATDLSFEHMKDKKIAVRRGYLYGSGPFKKAITGDKKFKEVTPSDSTEHSVRLLLKGRIDMFVGDYLPVMHYLINNDLASEVELVEKTATKENLVVLTWPTYFLFSKKSVRPSYVKLFDDKLKNMIDDGTYDAIYAKYNLRYKLAD
ncbi:putative amino acid ABC transporter, periplasmic amino acid-binding protein [Candidatus Terasakiella magnetica]|uniref:Putative amino acid ABC transporter, periplasmic amino acid-binding protein n=1 Tax=Candidatus Terasakiella magnetica TaxID=1867952 RepID=A0A1C3RKQ3_9PROT|nr:transporter substrate-binding domain-containing protein [Candidatus Terasakiella magnetica]SCA57801.1 putative amino acid ABC transporter, periplasmic amino acid-binding protein [Candidatus Terasakiella magnetica]